MFLVLLMIGVLPLKQHPLWTDSGGDFTASKYLGAICLLYAVACLFTRDRTPRYLETKQARWYALFFLLILVSYMQAPKAFSIAYNAILGPVSLLLLGFILLTVADSLKRLRLVLLAAIASVGWASLYVIKEWLTGRGWETGSRGEWVVGDSNHFAVSIIFGVSLAWYVAQAPIPGWQRWLCRACALLAFTAVVIGASRGGLLGLVVAMLFVTARSRKRTRLVAVLVMLLGFNIAYPYSPLRRLLHPDVSAKGSQLAHQASWEAGLKMVREHPIAGVGMSTFRGHMLAYAPDWYQDRPYMAHNAYISVAAEMGIPGLALFLTILITTFLSLERTYRMKSAPRLITQAAVALQAALVGSSISIAFISAEHHEYLWLTIFLSMCLHPLATRLSKRRLRTLPAGGRGLNPAALQNQA